MEDQTQVADKKNSSSRERDPLTSIEKLAQTEKGQTNKNKPFIFKRKKQSKLYAENARFQQDMHSQNAKQAYYTPVGVPAEFVTEKTDSKARSKGVMSIIFAIISLIFFPPVFGAFGVFTGFKARKLGASTLGLLGIILSLAFMTIGSALYIYYFNSIQANSGEFIGGAIHLILKIF